MFDEWAKNITDANGLGSDNIYANYANAGVMNASPEQITGNKMAVQATIDENNRQAAIARQKLIDQHEIDKLDPGKAQMRLNEDGSYSYYNGAGEKLNINQFSLLTGKRPDEILADSENPKDQKFVADYKTMKTFANAWVNGDNQTLQQLREADPEKFNQLISTYKSPSDMVSAFRDYYSDYYGKNAGQNKQDTATPSFSMQNVAGLPDNAEGKALASRLSGSPLSQTLAPVNTPVPKQGGDFGAFIDSLNPWGTINTQRRKYDEQAQNNPWLAYQSYLQK